MCQELCAASQRERQAGKTDGADSAAELHLLFHYETNEGKEEVKNRLFNPFCWWDIPHRGR
jgi:hypothetical protein